MEVWKNYEVFNFFLYSFHADEYDSCTVYLICSPYRFKISPVHVSLEDSRLSKASGPYYLFRSPRSIAHRASGPWNAIVSWTGHWTLFGNLVVLYLSKARISETACTLKYKTKINIITKKMRNIVKVRA